MLKIAIFLLPSILLMNLSMIPGNNSRSQIQPMIKRVQVDPVLGRRLPTINVDVPFVSYSPTASINASKGISYPSRSAINNRDIGITLFGDDVLIESYTNTAQFQAYTKSSDKVSLDTTYEVLRRLSVKISVPVAYSNTYVISPNTSGTLTHETLESNTTTVEETISTSETLSTSVSLAASMSSEAVLGLYKQEVSFETSISEELSKTTSITNSISKSVTTSEVISNTVGYNNQTSNFKYFTYQLRNMFNVYIYEKYSVAHYSYRNNPGWSIPGYTISYVNKYVLDNAYFLFEPITNSNGTITVFEGWFEYYFDEDKFLPMQPDSTVILM